MTAATYDIRIDQGSDFSLGVTLKDDNNAALDLTSYSARAQLRPKRNSTTLTASFTCSLNSPPTDGYVSMEMSNAVTKLITAGTYYYDLEIYTANDGYVQRVLEGKARVTQEVTR